MPATPEPLQKAPAAAGSAMDTVSALGTLDTQQAGTKAYDRFKLTWDSFHTQNAQRTYCYCGQDRNLDTLNIQCQRCLNWYHSACLQLPAHRAAVAGALPFMTNYVFLCGFCAGDTLDEQFEWTDTNWRDIIVTAIANLALQGGPGSLVTDGGGGRGNGDKSPGQSQSAAGVIPIHNGYSIDSHIAPYIYHHWMTLCPDKERNFSWKSVLYAAISQNTSAFSVVNGDGVSRAYDSYYSLTDACLWNIRPLIPITWNNKSLKRKADSTTDISLSQKRPASRTATRDLAEQTLLPGESNVSLSDHPFNKYGWKYNWAEEDPNLRLVSYRESFVLTRPGVSLSVSDRSPMINTSDDSLTVTTEKGWSSIRGTMGVKTGKWYFEVTVNKGGGEGATNNKAGSHVRLGWGRREASLQGPAGYDSYGYAYRDISGEKVHESVVEPYGEPWGSGDVIGVYIDIPEPTEKNASKNSQTIIAEKRDRLVIKYKGNLFYEGREYATVNSQAQIMADALRPSRQPQSSSATTSSIRSDAFPKAHGSQIVFFKNGVSQGVAYENIALPIAAAELVPEKERQAKDQAQKEQMQREEAAVYGDIPVMPVKDDGSLGYYPFISVYRGGNVTVNFGPEFKYPPSELSQQKRTNDSCHGWRPLSDRWPEREVENCVWDLVDETELWWGRELGLIAPVLSGAGNYSTSSRGKDKSNDKSEKKK